MTSPAVDVLLFRLGDQRLAVELQLVSSVLSADDAVAMDKLDPRPHLLAADADPEDIDDLDDDQLVGLLDIAGPPMVVILGEVIGARTLRQKDLRVVPPWLAGFLPPVLKPACTEIDQKVVWLLDIDTLAVTSLL